MAADNAGRRLLAQFGGRLVWSQAVIVTLLAVVMFIIFSFTLQGFIAPENLITLLRSVAVLGILGIGMAAVIIGRGIDLSMVPVMAVTVSVLFILVSKGIQMPVALLLTMGFALLLGALNGFLIAFVEIPALFTTLASGSIIFGVGQYFIFSNLTISAPESIGWLTGLGAGRIVGIPISILLFLSLIVIIHLLLKGTHKGRFIFAMGDNPLAARAGGVPVRPLIIVQYALVALLAFFAGLIMATAVGEMNTRIVYSNLPYNIILVAVIGGVGLSGGKGGMHNVLVGTLLIGILGNGMTIMDLTTTTQTIIQSLVLLLAIVIDGVLNPRDEQVSQQGDI